MLLYTLDSFLNISLQPSDFSQNTVGQKQYVICSVSLSLGMGSNTIELGWLYEDDITTMDNRVTIDASSDHFNGSIVVTLIQFDPLYEEDEGEYICYAVINGSFIFESIYLQKFKSKLFTLFILYDKISWHLSFNSIPLKPYFKGFYWGISNILNGVYLTYCPSHRVLIHLKGLTVNIKP